MLVSHPKAVCARTVMVNRWTEARFAIGQRLVIDYTTKYRGKEARNQAYLIEQLVSAYGETNRKEITSEVERIDALRGKPWTMKDIWVSFGKYSIQGNLPVHEGVEFASSRYAPEPRPLKDFGFAQVTWLIGRVGNRQFEAIRNLTESDQHAEERFIQAVEKANEKQDEINLGNNPQIVITINNSPCNAKCAQILAKWVVKWKLTKMTIYFGNPYGSKEDFQAAIQILQAAPSLKKTQNRVSLTTPKLTVIINLRGGAAW